MFFKPGIRWSKNLRNTEFSIEEQEDRDAKTGAIMMNGLIAKFSPDIFLSVDSIEDIPKLAIVSAIKNREPCHACWYEWENDDEFARQQINACRGFGVEKVFDALPSAYTITDADIEGILPAGKTISSEIVAGRLFMVDNSIMDGIPCGKHPKREVYFSYNIYFVDSSLLAYHKLQSSVIV